MISSDFRKEARRKLEGKWGKVALISLAYMAVFFVFGFIQGLFEEGSLIQSVLSLATTIVEIPLSFGLIIAFFKVYNSEDVKAFSFWSFGFNNFKKAWRIAFNMFLKLILPIILIIVSVVIISILVVTAGLSGISGNTSATEFYLLLAVGGFILYIIPLIWLVMKTYYYSLAYILAADDESLTAKEAVERSKELMTGKRGKLFCLQLSFIGWAILATFTLGIGFFWLLPYMQFATFAFYYFVANKVSNETIMVQEDPINSNDNNYDSLS